MTSLQITKNNLRIVNDAKKQVEGELTAANGEKTRLEEQIAVEKEAKDKAEDDLRIVNEAKNKLTEELKTVKEAKAKVEEQLAAATGKVTDLEVELNTKTTELTTVNEAKDKLAADLATEKEVKTAKVAELDTKTAELTAANDKVGKLERHFEDVNDKIYTKNKKETQLKKVTLCAVATVAIGIALGVVSAALYFNNIGKSVDVFAMGGLGLALVTIGALVVGIVHCLPKTKINELDVGQLQVPGQQPTA